MGFSYSAASPSWMSVALIVYRAANWRH